MKTICVICDSEKDYACGFMEYANRKKTMPFEVVACTSNESLHLFAEGNDVDILLIAEDNLDPEIDTIPASLTIVLDEGHGREDTGKYKKIYKYQSCDAVLRDVCDSMSEMHTEFARQGQPLRSDKKIIGVYSPCGGCGTTTFALAAAAVLSEKKKVLFAELTQFSGLTDIYGVDPERGLSDLFFYFETGRENVLTKLAGMVYEGPGFDILPPLSAPDDLFGVLPIDWTAMFEEIVEDGVYDVLVLDFGFPSFEMLEICSEIYMPLAINPLSDLKQNAFLNALLNSRYEAAFNKIRPVYIAELEKNYFPEDFYHAPGKGVLGQRVRNAIAGKGDQRWKQKYSASKNPDEPY